MWPDSWETALWIVGRCVAVYIVVLIGFRLMGKRELGQMTPFDLVLILLIANAVQNAMVGSDTSLSGGILAAVVLLSANAATAQLRFLFPRFGRLVEGHPTLLINDGKFLQQNLQRERLSEDEVLMAIREHGFDEAARIKLAVLEVDGTIIIVPQDAKTVRTKRRVRQVHHQ